MSIAFRPDGVVLNAFRHHRGRHTEIAQFVRRDAVVLNAFRHHRGRHTQTSRRDKGDS